MWVLSEDRTDTILVGRFKREGRKILGFTLNDNCQILLGEYKEENFAKKIYDEIVGFLEYNYSVVINNVGQTHFTGTRRSVYKMPSE